MANLGDLIGTAHGGEVVVDVNGDEVEVMVDGHGYGISGGDALEIGEAMLKAAINLASRGRLRAVEADADAEDVEADASV